MTSTASTSKPASIAGSEMPAGLDQLDDERDWLDDPRALVVCEANKEQHVREKQLSSEIWAGSQPPEVTRERWQALFQAEWLKTSKRISVLVPRMDPDTIDFLATHVMVRVPILVAPARQQVVQRSEAYYTTVAIVPPEHRGNSYGTLMATLLSQQVAAEHRQSKSRPAMIIGISEVPARIWSAAGGRVYSATEVGVYSSAYACDDLPDNVFYLDAEGVYAQLDVDERNVQRELLRRPPGKTRFAIAPCRQVYEILIKNELALLKWSRGPDRLPDRFGAKVGESYCFWQHYLTEGVLHLSRFVATTPDEARLLLIAACNEAEWWSLARVVCWDFPTDMAHALDLDVNVRDTNLPMALSCAKGELDWVCRQRYISFLE